MQTFCTMADGRSLGLWVTKPSHPPRAGLMILHEAFGVTPHIQRVCAAYTAQGYLCAAPAMLMVGSGRPEGVVLPQNKEGLDEGRKLIMATPIPAWVAMMQATHDWLTAQGVASAALGYCWGGSCAYLAGVHLKGLKASVAYYGGMLGELAAQAQPACPTLIHLATADRYIPIKETCQALAHHHPAATVHVYEADHGFNRDDGKAFDAAASLLARQRTDDFLTKAFQ